MAALSSASFIASYALGMVPPKSVAECEYKAVAAWELLP